MEGYDASDGLSVEFPRYSNLVSAVHRSLSVNKRNYFQDNDTTVLLKNAFPQHLDSIGEPECSGFSVACGSGEFHQVRPHLERGGWILDNNAQLSLHDPNSGFKWAMDNRPGWETAISSALSTRDDCLGAQPLAMPNLDIVKLQSGILPLDNSHLTTAIDFHHRTSIPGWNLQELPGGDSSTKEVSSFAMSRQVHQEANTDLEPYAFQTFEAYERESVTPTQQIARSDEHESQEIPTIEHHTCPVCKRFSSDVRNLREYMRCHERQHKCPHDSCSRSFSTQRDLRRHRKAVHQKIAIACPICSASIRGGRRDNLKRHMRACHPFES